MSGAALVLTPCCSPGCLDTCVCADSSGRFTTETDARHVQEEFAAAEARAAKAEAAVQSVEAECDMLRRERATMVAQIKVGGCRIPLCLCRIHT